MRTSSQSKLRFSLRSLLVVVTLAACLMGWLAYHFDWIRQRHQFAREQASRMSMLDAIEGDPPREASKSATFQFSSSSVPASRKAPPGMLWLFGETGHHEMIVVVEADENEVLSAESELRLQLARRLFSEAMISLLQIEPELRYLPLAER